MVSIPKSKVEYFALTVALGLTLLAMQSTGVAAAETSQTETSEFTVLAGDDLKNNPTALKILQKIEISKQRIAELQKRQNELVEHQKMIDEQRRIAKEQVAAQLARMDRDNVDFTPRASFARFLTNSVNGTYHNVFWGQFDYLDAKVQLGRAAMVEVLQNGGSHSEAREAYIKFVSMSKMEMIELNKKLNIQYGFADETVQTTFDKYGKLPRYS